jgi:vitamin-K-epoxide reductase (warfarin-sensitive)
MRIQPLKSALTKHKIYFKPITIRTEKAMKYILIILSLCGIVAASLALREHYRTDDDSPCSINERWDCGIVNKSPYAMVAGKIPVAVVGIAGYLFMAILAFRRSYRLLLGAALTGLAYSLYLAHIESAILGVWCVYCVASLSIVSLIALLTLGTVIAQAIRKPSPA